MNQKKILKLDHGLYLPVMESFYTIQGEGYYKGSAAYFIRIAGCDVGCHWCDVKESWDSNIHPIKSIEKIVQNVKNKCEIVVITGGEPLIWDMNPLTELLKNNNFKTHLETSGSNKLTGNWDWICLSPKKRKIPLSQVYKKADELKIIIYNKNDLKFAEKEAKKVSKNCILFLQPEWSKRDEMMPVIVDYIMNNSKWKVSLQTHKYLNIS
ncbi:MAG: 7-carboxy-7-deazaguanine synthase QueE [Flavobacteriaceae bacterium]|nr:7-carboxy-7-deazaguanine synthase QueE [Flavobacteriaceae bacterium]|tara:strand:- start:5921 stop:6550 length:630 start_codon:yes stop_codon:yes gene_type:complete